MWAAELDAALGTKGEVIRPTRVQGQSGVAADDVALLGFGWRVERAARSCATVLVLGYHAFTLCNGPGGGSADGNSIVHITPSSAASNNDDRGEEDEEDAESSDAGDGRLSTIHALGWSLRTGRLLVDEPQDADAAIFSTLVASICASTRC